MSNEMKYAVDIPNPYDLDGEMINMDYFEKRKQAIKWAQKHLGADSKGRICVVSKMPED